MRQDLDHLNALSICHFVYAGLELLAMLAGAFYLVIGIIILTAPAPPPPPGAAAPPVPVGDTPGKPYAIDPRYISYQQSGLTANVEAKSNTITFTIERRKR